MLELTRYAVEQWIKNIATGEFHYKQVLDGNVKPIAYGNLRKIMFDLCKVADPAVESIGRRDGYYRPIQDMAPPLDWQGIDRHRDSGLLLPFDLRKYVFIYPDTVTIFAGSKSSGKTGIIYRTVAMNMHRANTILLTNLEGGITMLRDRFDAMDIDIPTPAPFKVLYVTENFHDYIREPNTVYAIDYIDAPEGTDFYLIGAAINKVSKKLQGLNSVAVIGLQKPSTRDTAFGGEGTLKVATLYVAMDNSKLKIVDAKVPADKKIHPRNMQWTYLYDDEGTKFINIVPSYEGG